MREQLSRASSAADDLSVGASDAMPSNPHSNGKAKADAASNGKVKADAVSGKGAGKPAPGARLAAAFEAIERFPALSESRSRVMQAATAETARIGDIVEAVESDVGLTIAVLRYANRAGVEAGGIAGVPAAVDVLKPSGLLAIAGTAPAFDFFEPNGGWELKTERFRVHALATQQAADEIGRAVGRGERDQAARGAGAARDAPPR